MYGKQEKEPSIRYVKKYELVETKTELPIQGQIHDPEDLDTFFRDLQNEQVSKVIAIYLDDNFLLLGHQVFLGATSATLETRLVYHYHALFLAKNFILLVNHPSGDPLPSDDDLKLMRSLMVDANALSFHPGFSDFVIVGDKSYYSMAFDKGLVESERHRGELRQ